MATTPVTPKSTQYARANPARHRAYAKAFYHRNKEACKAKAAQWRKDNPDKAARMDERQKLKPYGLTPRTFAALIALQYNACAICTDPFDATPHVDHCHDTGRTRGLLCQACNTALGKFRDNPTTLRAAADYLERNL